MLAFIVLGVVSEFLLRDSYNKLWYFVARQRLSFSQLVWFVFG